MGVAASIFFDFNLPNPTTWFYLSSLLAVALFFKFTRLLSMRNLDVLSLYGFVPGLLLLGERGHELYGYIALMIACGWFLVRCLLDLALVRRPALGMNLESAGMAWLGAALFAGLLAVSARQPVPVEVKEDADPRTPTGGVQNLWKRVVKASTAPGADDSQLRLWAERSLAVLTHLSVVLGLWLIGLHHYEDSQTGVGMAACYLLLPYTFLLLPDSALGVGRWDHAWAMSLVVWAIYAYRRPVLSGALLGLAMGTAFYLVVTLPAWLSFYRGRGLKRFATAAVVALPAGLAVLGGLLWLNGELPLSLQSGWTTSAWMPWKSGDVEPIGLWEGVRPVYRLPVFILSMTLVALTSFWPSPKNLGHVVALSAASLIGVQFWYGEAGGIYVLWFVPLLLLVVFRPNVSALVAPVPDSEHWMSRFGRRVSGRWARRAAEKV